MIKKIAYNNFLKTILRLSLGLIYNKKYLKGIYFDTKRMGWFWAVRSLGNKIIGSNRKIPWPVHPRTIISNANNLEFDVDDIHIFQTPGCYWQNHDAMIKIGTGCYVAPNVRLITTNHDIYNIRKHQRGKDINIGDACWIGMNSIILPGVEIGPHTIVGAGAVVTKSFPDGYCIIGGNPAKIIKKLDKTFFLENQGKNYEEKNEN